MILLKKRTVLIVLLLAAIVSVMVSLTCACSSSAGDRPRLLYFRSAT
jgi:hypothetical protein